MDASIPLIAYAGLFWNTDTPSIPLPKFIVHCRPFPFILTT